MMFQTKGTWLVAVAGVLLAFSGTSVAFAQWSGPSASPPGGNTPAPLNIGASTQTKNGGLVVEGLSATVLCLPGVAPTGGCISTWPAGGSGGTGLTGAGTPYYVPMFTGVNTLGNSSIMDDGSAVTVSGRSLNVTSPSGTWAGNFTGVGEYALIGRNTTYGSDGRLGYSNMGVYGNGPGYGGYFVGGIGGFFSNNSYYTYLDYGSYSVYGNGNFYNGATWFTNGDIYMPWAGNYLSNMLSSGVRYGATWSSNSLGPITCPSGYVMYGYGAYTWDRNQWANNFIYCIQVY